MRQAEASGWIVQNSSGAMMRALRLAAIVLGIGLVMSANAARAEDDEDDSTFEEKIIKQIMTGSAAPIWRTPGSTTASARRWWFLPRSTCRRRLPPRSKLRCPTGRRILMCESARRPRRHARMTTRIHARRAAC